MAKSRVLLALAAASFVAFAATGAASASEVRGDRPASEGRAEREGRDDRVVCERLESKLQHLRIAIARLEALEQRIERLIAGGTLTEVELARARHALAKIERAQEQLENRLERLLDVYAEHCRR